TPAARSPCAMAPATSASIAATRWVVRSRDFHSRPATLAIAQRVKTQELMGAGVGQLEQFQQLCIGGAQLLAFKKSRMFLCSSAVRLARTRMWNMLTSHSALLRQVGGRMLWQRLHFSAQSCAPLFPESSFWAQGFA